MGMMQEFKEFAVKGNVIDLAVGVIIGAAFAKIVAQAFDPDLHFLAERHALDVAGRHRRFHFHAPEVDHVEQVKIGRHFFTGLHGAVADQAGDRRPDHGIGQRFLCHVECCLCRIDICLRDFILARCIVEGILRNETLAQQDLVVVARLGGDVELPTGCQQRTLCLR